ncbi:SET family sugar efflux transporter-like MFS transporter [Actinoplanes lutulentus]|uniref:SET family sugar efflux transporter-like MFS transporter n=1 Tax=Actinoplanes lutulentus TaxID=1287878 RepID=A0A327Z525_9ACTN|nr:MFS transporter [Actinoplanes lutulentus]MBB2946324.1 SET family sugar efflux transporter-like MFS transporter [Actinoplanes lutulentus]RAK28737.1 SET family sugar efflux transporter-like MFS transporter [Actinoplanes lutulentus]
MGGNPGRRHDPGDLSAHLRRLLVPSAALLWGLQFALLNPVLAVLLVGVFDATAAQVGGALAVYNASGFAASLLLPGYADRRQEYVRPMLACAILTLALAGALALTTSLPVAVCALVVLGGPAGVGTSLLFAHLKHSGAAAGEVVRTRAVVSVAWVAGPPLAAFVLTGSGPRAVLVLLAAVAVLTIAATTAMLRTDGPPPAPEVGGDDRTQVSRGRVATIMVVFVALQATNGAVVSIMTLFVTDRMRLDVAWAGIALGAAAALEIPALLIIGRLSSRIPALRLIASGCLAGIVYYLAMAYAQGPVTLLGLQVLNAWFFAAIAGVGLTLFQDIVARPGLASGLYVNTRRIGAIVAGAIISAGSATSLGYSGVFLTCAAIAAGALLILGAVSRASVAEQRNDPATRAPNGIQAARPQGFS